MVKGREGLETARWEMMLAFQCQWSRDPDSSTQMKMILQLYSVNKVTQKKDHENVFWSLTLWNCCPVSHSSASPRHPRKCS